MAATMSVRLASRVRERLHARARETHEAPTALAQRLIDEGLRREEHPQIVFRPAPTGGRVAGLAGGPDLAEVIQVIRNLDPTGTDAVEQAAEWLSLPSTQVQAAIRYYAAYADDVDAEIARRAAVAIRVEQELDRRERLLS